MWVIFLLGAAIAAIGVLLFIYFGNKVWIDMRRDELIFRKEADELENNNKKENK